MRNHPDGMNANGFAGMWRRLLTPLGIASVKKQQLSKPRTLDKMQADGVPGALADYREEQHLLGGAPLPRENPSVISPEVMEILSTDWWDPHTAC